MIRPIDVTAKLLFPKWKMKPGDKDFTSNENYYKRKRKRQTTTYQYNLFDKYQNNTISMARTTGFTCTAVANLIVNGKYNKTGISPPEYLGEHFDFVKAYLNERGVVYNMKKN